MDAAYTFLYTDYREPLFYKSIISTFYIRHAVNLRGCDIYAAPFFLISPSFKAADGNKFNELGYAMPELFL
jgi:hypothetical protein